MSDESRFLSESDMFGPNALFPRRYNERQLSDLSFGYVVARVVCNQCGNREIAQGRKFADGVLHFLVPEPEGGRTRGMFVARKLRHPNWPVEQTYIAYLLDEIPTDVPTILRCPKHGKRQVPSQLILDGITKGKATHPRVIRV